VTSPVAVLSILYICDAVFMSLKQNCDTCTVVKPSNCQGDGYKTLRTNLEDNDCMADNDRLLGILDPSAEFRNLIDIQAKVKQSHNRPRGSQEVEASRFQDSRHMQVVRFSALCTGRLYPPGNIPGTHCC
jgi:hypothetical protein